MAKKVAKKNPNMATRVKPRARVPQKKVSLVVLVVLALASVVTVAWLIDKNFR